MKHAASLILKTSSKFPKVLMVQRQATGKFGSFTVFPGGVVDASDSDLKMTALRETMEETGLLLTNDIKCLDLSSRNKVDQVHNVDMSTLIHLSTWITPPNQKYRYHTTFFLKTVDYIPDCIPDGVEIVKVYTKTIPELLQDFRNGKISLMPPQWILLNVLNGDILQDKFIGIIDPEEVYRSETKMILALPGDYQHSKRSNRQFRIIGKLENGRAIEYKLIDDEQSKL
jgi:8-oxo-dGTP pyrophosphatase MutT (NUDIX family)